MYFAGSTVLGPWDSTRGPGFSNKDCIMLPHYSGQCNRPRWFRLALPWGSNVLVMQDFRRHNQAPQGLFCYKTLQGLGRIRGIIPAAVKVSDNDAIAKGCVVRDPHEVQGVVRYCPYDTGARKLLGNNLWGIRS